MRLTPRPVSFLPPICAALPQRSGFASFQCRTLRARNRPTTTPRAEPKRPTAVTIAAAYCHPSPTPFPHQPFFKPA